MVTQISELEQVLASDSDDLELINLVLKLDVVKTIIDRISKLKFNNPKQNTKTTN